MLAALIAASAMGGCAGGSEASSEPSNSSQADESCQAEPAEADGDIVVWGWSVGEVQTPFDAFVEDTGYNGKMEYVTIQQTEAFQKLQTTISAGLDLPDAISSEIGQRGTMMSLGIWEDLSAEPYNFDETTIFDYFGSLCKDESGAFVCIPMDISTAGMAYKKDLAEQYLGTSDRGELEAMLSDWDSFKQVGIDLQKDTNGEVFMFTGLSSVKYIIDGQNSTPVISDNKLDLENSVHNALNFMVDFRNNKVCDNISESSPAYSASFADDLHIFYPCASWGPAYVIGPNDPDGADTWGLMIPPGGCFSMGGSGNMIPADAKNKMGAYKFISWLVSKDGTTRARELTGNNYANKEAYNDPDFAQMSDPSFGDQNLGEILFVEGMPTIDLRPVSEYDVTITEVWNYVIEAVNSDSSMDTQKAMELFETEIRNKLPNLD